MESDQQWGKGAILPHKHKKKKKKSQSHIMTLSKASGMQDLRTNIHSGIYIKGKNKQLSNCRHPLDLRTHIEYICCLSVSIQYKHTHTAHTHEYLCLSIDKHPIFPFKI